MSSASLVGLHSAKGNAGDAVLAAALMPPVLYTDSAEIEVPYDPKESAIP